MEIRPAKFDDIKQIIPFLVEAAESVPTMRDIPVDETEIRNTFQRAINQRECAVFLSFEGETLTGVIAGIANRIWCSKKKQVIDLVFYVHPDYRGHGFYLARRYLGWGKKVRGAVEVFLGVTSGMDTDRTCEMYEKLGLERIGAVYRVGVPNVESR